MSPNPNQHAKATWFIIYGALTLSVLIYGLLVYFFEQTGNRPASTDAVHAIIRPILYAVDGVALILAVVMPKRMVSKQTPVDPQMPIGSTPLPSPPVFLQATITALSFSESCAVSGLFLFFLGEPAKEFWNFASLTLVFNLAYILPKGIQYWSTIQQ